MATLNIKGTLNTEIVFHFPFILMKDFKVMIITVVSLQSKNTIVLHCGSLKSWLANFSFILKKS